MTLLTMIIPVAILTVLLSVVLVVAGLFMKKEDRRFTGTDVVLGGVQFLALAATVLAVVSVLFAAVDYKIPDALVDAVYRDTESIRIALAVMLVTMPIFAFVLHRAARKVSWMQRFVAMDVLVCAGGALVGVVIALVYNFLAGELGIRLLVKTFTLAIIAGGVGGYYVLFMHEGKTVSRRATKIFLIVAGLVVVKALVWGFIISGGPLAARAERFDDRRLSDLYNLQSQVQSYWQENRTLPQAITDLNNPLSNYAVPTDPETATPYVYRRISETQEPSAAHASGMRRVGMFEICATFATERMVGNNASGKDYVQPSRDGYLLGDSFLPYYYRDDVSPYWNHGIGDHCFTRTIKEPLPM